MATFLELGNGKYPKKIQDRRIEPLEGRSLLPIFKNELRNEHESLYFRFGMDRALRQGKWKLVSAKGGKWELYNLKQDRTELNDLSKDFPQRVEQMSKEWFEIAKNKERLNSKLLQNTNPKVKSLSFRKDTSEQLID